MKIHAVVSRRIIGFANSGSVNRIILMLSLILSIAFANAHGDTIDEVLLKARMASPVYASLRASAGAGDFEAMLRQYDRQNTYAVGVDSSWMPESSSGDSSVTLSPYFSFESGDDNVTTARLSAPMTLVYKTDSDSRNKYVPELSVGQKILVDAVKDEGREISIRRARIQADSLANKLEAQFEMSVCDSVRQVLSCQSAFETAKASYEKGKADYGALEDGGFIKEGDYAYNQSAASLLASLSAMETAARSLDSALDGFERVCGFAFEEAGDIDIGVPDLDFTLLEEGNSSVALAHLDKMLAENEYKILMRNGSRVIDAGLGASLGMTGQEIQTVEFKGSAGYSEDLWKISAGAEVKLDAEGNRAYPRFTLAGEFKIGSARSRTDDLERQKALVEFHTKSLDYETALFEYRSSAASLMARMAAAKSELSRQGMILENARTVMRNDEELYDKGYYSDLEFAVRVSEFVKAENDWKSFLLSLAELECEGKILNS